MVFIRVGTYKVVVYTMGHFVTLVGHLQKPFLYMFIVAHRRFLSLFPPHQKTTDVFAGGSPGS